MLWQKRRSAAVAAPGKRFVLNAQKKRWWLRLNEKNGKVHEMPCHHKLEAYLDAYIAKAGIARRC